MSKVSPKRLYLIPILSKALDVLEVLQASDRPLPLEAIYQRTHISRTTVYRILKTFVHRGYLSQSQDGQYRFTARPRKVSFGFGIPSLHTPASAALAAAIRHAAVRAGVDLVVLEHGHDADAAARAAEEFIGRRIDLALAFQLDSHIAPLIADKIAAAGIPLISVEYPLPHATYYGLDNFRAGLDAGAALAAYVADHWSSRPDSLIGFDIADAGAFPQSRITGVFESFRSRIPDLPSEIFIRLDGRGLRAHSFRLISEFLARHPGHRHIAIAAANHLSAQGALDALYECRRPQHAAIVAIDSLPQPALDLHAAASGQQSPFIASVLPDAAAYGPKLIQLGLSLLRGLAVQPYNFAEHRLLTASMLRRRESEIAARG